MSNTIVTHGLLGPFMATEGYGYEGGVPAPSDTGDVLTDYLARGKALFITQFRALRNVEVSTLFFAKTYNSDPSSEGILSPVNDPVTDHVSRGLSLFITQFSRRRAYV